MSRTSRSQTRLCAGVSALVLAVALPLPSQAQKGNETLFAAADATIRLEGEHNDGAAGALVVAAHRRTLILFDLARVELMDLASARLILRVRANGGGWGERGRRVYVHRLTSPWAEAAVTWRCPEDRDPSNLAADCDAEWQGGAFDASTAPGVLHDDATSVEVSWEVTADVLRGAELGWLVTADPPLSTAAALRSNEAGQDARVEYYSREGAAAAGDPGLGPRLVLAYASAVPPPILRRDQAVVAGSVLDVLTRLPLPEATVSIWRLPPKGEALSDLEGLGASAANGSFEVETLPFEGTRHFIVRVYKEGYTEAIRRIDGLEAGSCRRVDDALLNPAATPVKVRADEGHPGLEDPTGTARLSIPPGALMRDSEIAVTLLASHEALRDRLPFRVAAAGTFVDISGVFGEETTKPVTLRLPNSYDLPPGTRVPFGKIDHNTAEWQDLSLAEREKPGGGGDLGAGVVTADRRHIEVSFTHFCTICTGYCLTIPDPVAEPEDAGGLDPGRGGDPDAPGNAPCNSVINLKEGHLWETVPLPPVQEMGRTFRLTFGYFSGAAKPSATLSARSDYRSARPVERTIYAFEVEGTEVEAAYDRTENNIKPHGTYVWDGRDFRGELLPTGVYRYTARATSLNSQVGVGVPVVFGGPAVQQFQGAYPGNLPVTRILDALPVPLINLRDSPYGAGWSLLIEERLHFAGDGSVLLVQANSEYRIFRPAPGRERVWDGPPGEFSTIELAEDGRRVTRSFDDGRRHEYLRLAVGKAWIERIVDRYGDETTFTYSQGSSRPLLASLVTPRGYAFDFQYAAGRISSIVDSAGRVTRFQVDARGDLAAVTDAEGATRRFDYDGEHLLIAQRGPRGERSEYGYSNGRATEVRAYDTDGATLLRRRRFNPNLLRREIGFWVGTGRGSVALPILVVPDRIDAYTDGRGVERLQETDLQGNVVWQMDGLGRRTEYAYDSNRKLRSRRRPDGSLTSYEYDARGNVTLIEEHSSGARSRWEYDPESYSQPARFIDAEDKQTLFRYASSGSLEEVEDHLGNLTRLRYEDPRFAGLATTLEFPTGETLRLFYDAQGNLETAIGASGATVTIINDRIGNAIQVFDPRPGVPPARLSYDRLGRLTGVRDAGGGMTSIEYDDDACGCSTANVTAVTVANGGQTRYRYDGLNRLLARIDPLGASEQYEYDAEGNLLSALNRGRQLTLYEYDAASQLVSKIEGGKATAFAYDLLGNLAAADDGACRLELAHDSLGRLEETTTLQMLETSLGATDPLEHVISYQYDRANNRIGATDGLGTWKYRYDDLHRLDRLAYGKAAWTFEHDALGRRRLQAAPNGVTTAYAYDAAGRLTSIRHAAPGGLPLAELSYRGYDEAENLTSQTIRRAAESFEFTYLYDDLNRLATTESSALPAERFIDVAYEYDLANRLLRDSEFSYGYDKDGRLVRRQEAASGVVTTYRYDAGGLLLELQEFPDDLADTAPVLTARYRYDPLGRRVAKDVNGVVTRYLYDREDIIHQTDARGVVTMSFVHGPGIDEPLSYAEARAGRWFHSLSDRLGNIVGLSDDIGGSVQQYLYDDFGELIRQSAAGPRQAFGFNGREPDHESGFYYYRARYYAPHLGRFVTEDPVGFEGGINAFTYVNNNPLKFRDPFGLKPCKPDCYTTCYSECLEDGQARYEAPAKALDLLLMLQACLELDLFKCAAGLLVPSPMDAIVPGSYEFVNKISCHRRCRAEAVFCQ